MKSLVEHHYFYRIQCLEDDPRLDSFERMKAVERMAKDKGWQYPCTTEYITICMNQSKIMEA